MEELLNAIADQVPLVATGSNTLHGYGQEELLLQRMVWKEKLIAFFTGKTPPTPEERQLFLSFCDAEELLAGREALAEFAAGFKLGAQMMAHIFPTEKAEF